ncbi:MAG: type II toxin-antitoxin system RelE/ParE family toxin [Candidatus Aminicenantes bacterium]|nr:type II toxin-antitoxin system RelE/ParE family toxin [Candidatus Aminicenantes bacterium]NIM85125.1 type II toxin-antitoxin system RelE/ParE family toxin [Candidatus Aminicenantes bacterium]NIN24635.1 type II toxin-antitoxin system RelE/ParE family toxin [Candidatus Aminicenantes bacterium]NIN48396.1 type II toxin-antitoxin system RelE/ParE family toxin [Candidatus Aminicenantes bacterium]NIN91299.1 type II toxin-antitoxin system RelE/ParE family toxin [Candidatus Aminicenantes bacterium]
MKYFFHPEAKKELVEAINYYNKCGTGLGYIFMDEVQATIDRILQFPKAWSKLTKNTRRCITRRFPYGVIYQEREDDILIISIMHMNRKPGYWEDRVEPFTKNE